MNVRASNPLGLISAAAVILASAGAAHAQPYLCTVNSTTSSLSSTIGVNVSLNGSFRGSYVQATNPTGTRTNPGLGSAAAPINNPINFTGTGGTASPPPAVNTRPSGTFFLKLNPTVNEVTLSALDIDLRGASPAPTLATSLSISYSTFRTFAPNYNYFSLGVPVPVPLGNATVTALRLTQDSAVFGTLTPGAGGSYTFSLVVPCTIDSTVELQGSASGTTGQSQLTISGTVSPGPAGAQTISLTLTAPTNITQQIPPAPGVPIPFELPPPPFSSGPNANVILTANIVSPSSTTIAGTTTLPSAGVKLLPVDIADDQGNLPPRSGIPNNGVTEGDYNAFFANYFDANPLVDIADDQGTPLPGSPDVPNNGVTEGDYNCFFSIYFSF
jgi:hypothetical protein